MMSEIAKLRTTITITSLGFIKNLKANSQRMPTKLPILKLFFHTSPQYTPENLVRNRCGLTPVLYASFF